MYFGSSVSSTEIDINMWLAKAWPAINILSIIKELDVPNKIKRNFLYQRLCKFYSMDAMYRRWLSVEWKGELLNNATNYIPHILPATIHKAPAVWSPTSHLSNNPNKTIKT